MLSSAPSRRAAATHSSAPGAEVNRTASTSPAPAASTERRTASASGGGPHRYTVRLTTSAPCPSKSSSSPSAPDPWCCTAMRRPSTPSARRYAPSSVDVSDSATQSAVSPACWIAPRAFGPRATIWAPSNAACRSSSSPASSAASIQPRNPTPVLATTISGGFAMSSRVRAMRASSSMCGTIVSAGACRTVAPWRSRAAASSPERRSTAITMVQPSSAAERVGRGLSASPGSVTRQCALGHQEVGGGDVADDDDRGIAALPRARRRRARARAWCAWSAAAACVRSR